MAKKITIVYNRIDPNEIIIDPIETSVINGLIRQLCSTYQSEFKTGLKILSEKRQDFKEYMQLLMPKLEANEFLMLHELQTHLWRLDFIEMCRERGLLIPASWNESIETTHIDVYSQNMDTIPESISMLYNLIHLQFYDNKIRTLPKGIYHLHDLEFLGLQNNSLSMIGSNIQQLHKLQILFAGNNRINYVSHTLGTLNHLTMLYLDNNLLKKIPSAIGKLSKLSFLNLAHNQLEILPTTIEKMTHLQHLILTGNPMPRAYVTDLQEAMPWCKIEF